jgi:hypothetical protein
MKNQASDMIDDEAHLASSLSNLNQLKRKEGLQKQDFLRI